MSLELIRQDWEEILKKETRSARRSIKLINPFVQLKVAKIFLKKNVPIKLITRLNLNDFLIGVSNLYSLRDLVGQGHEVRGVFDLHAKVFLFDDTRAIIASTNLTNKALKSNHEAGLLTDEPDVLKEIVAYFDCLWSDAQSNVTIQDLEKMDAELNDHIRNSSPLIKPKLGDYGKRIGIFASSRKLPKTPSSFDLSQASNYFVKFSGSSKTRVSSAMSVTYSVRETHFLTGGFFPPSKRPRIVQDGDVIFLSRLVENPNDIRIFGRAYAYAYVEGRDDASEADILKTSWMKNWPHFIRLRDIEMIIGTLEQGISLNGLIEQFGVNTFVATKRRSETDSSVNPRNAYRQQAAVRLTEEVAIELNFQLEQIFQKFGRLTERDFEQDKSV